MYTSSPHILIQQQHLPLSLTLSFAAFLPWVPFGTTPRNPKQCGLFILPLTYLSFRTLPLIFPWGQLYLQVISPHLAQVRETSPTCHLSKERDRMVVRGHWAGNMVLRPELGWGEWSWVMQMLGQKLPVSLVSLLYQHHVFDHCNRNQVQSLNPYLHFSKFLINPQFNFLQKDVSSHLSTLVIFLGSKEQITFLLKNAQICTMNSKTFENTDLL